MDKPPRTDADGTTVEVVYALPDRQTLLTVQVPAGATVDDAVRRSGLFDRYPELALPGQRVGIWSRPVPWTEPVQAGDRIELYRPLKLDPSTTLRQRERAKRRR